MNKLILHMTLCLGFCLLAAACSKIDVDGTPALQAIGFKASAGNSKTIVPGGSTMPENFTVYASAYFHSNTATEQSGDYFIAKPFNKSATKDSWGADPEVYWPLGGTLTFLCVACEADKYNINTNANWSKYNCTDGVELNVADYSMLTNELMFTNAATREHQNSDVELEFSHSQAWIQFTLNCKKENMIMLDSIVISHAYVGGKFIVRNDVFATGEWSFRSHYRKNVVVPESRFKVLGAETVSCSILLPEQQSCQYLLYYRQKAYPEQSWDDAYRNCYEGTTGFDQWYYGTHYTYVIDSDCTSIRIIASVQEWTDDSRYVILE